MRARIESVTASVLRPVLQLETSRFADVEWHLVPDMQASNGPGSALRGIGARLPAVTLDLQPGEGCWIYLRGRTPDPTFLPIYLHPSLESYGRAVVVGDSLWLPFPGLVLGVALLNVHFGLVFQQRLSFINAPLVIVYCNSGYWAWLGLPATRWVMCQPMLAIFQVTSLTALWFNLECFNRIPDGRRFRWSAGLALAGVVGTMFLPFGWVLHWILVPGLGA